ncbi:MAG: coproporphyrinogen-III oxidase family protein [Planctomycetota bacterium]
MMSAEERQDNQPVTEGEKTTVGNYFVANYPPFSFWTEDQIGTATKLLETRPDNPPDLGVYVHLPFCRKRCDFCYFKVYTDKNAADVQRYLDAVLTEARAYAARPYIEGRLPKLVYFGGGTPSYLSTSQLTTLFEGLREVFDWSRVEEITFECEPGTLTRKKIEVLHDLGVTRLSLGVENFDAEILELNNRAHRAQEIFEAYETAREVGFRQINLDLIAGMVGETEENWQHCIEKTLELEPESVTIYQLEVPYNTTIYQRMKNGGVRVAPVADWPTKRRWTDEAFAALEKAGYQIGSAYTAKKDDSVQFLYRDALWTGADLLGLGVSSFGHLGGIHLQNEHRFEPYVERVEKGELPIHRALQLEDDERLIREFVLQLKLGHLSLDYFRNRFGVDPRERFADTLEGLAASGEVAVTSEAIDVSREALLRVDELLPRFFRAEHRNARYA